MPHDGNGDLASARIAVLTQVSLVASTQFNDPLQTTMAHPLGDMASVLQRYTSKDKLLAESFVYRAEAIRTTNRSKCRAHDRSQLQ